MKRKIVLLLILSAVAIFFFAERQAAKPSGGQAGTVSLETFNGVPPFLNIAFEYPQGWRVSVSRAKGAEEATVQLIGPRDLDRQFSTSIAVIGKKETETVALTREVEELVERNRGLDQFKLVSKGTVKVAGQNVPRVTFDFVIPLPVGFPNAPLIVMREEVVWMSRNDRLYQVHFIGTLEQHQQNKGLFEDLLRSFRVTE